MWLDVWLDEHMNSERNQPHQYQGHPGGAGAGWRTCQVCGRGANAQIHKKEAGK